MPSFTVPFFQFFLSITYNEDPRLITRIHFAFGAKEEQDVLPPWAEAFKTLLKKCVTDEHFIPDLDWLDLGSCSRVQRDVYRALALVRPGETIAYAQLAQKALLSRGAARYVGHLMAINPFPIIIPCHRVIRSNGSSGGYAGGEEMKKFLLNQEKMLKFNW